MKKERLLSIIDELTEMQSNVDIDITELFSVIGKEAMSETWDKANEVINFLKLKEQQGPRKIYIESGTIKIMCESYLVDSIVDIIGFMPITLDGWLVFKFIEI